MSLDGGPSLDQLRIFAAVVDTGSFSAAGRRLKRTQPVISYAIGVLEDQLGMLLFERGRRRPVLTDKGVAMLAYARRMCLLADELRAGAASLNAGLEGAMCFAVDAFFPAERLASVLRAFAETYPSAAADVLVEPRDKVLQHVIERDCAFGVAAWDAAWPAGVEARDFGAMTIVPVASPDHPLALYPGLVPASVVRDSIQLILKKPDGPAESPDIAVNSNRLWRVGDMKAKLALLRAGVGWAYAPLDVVAEDLSSGRLTRLALSTRAGAEQPFCLVHRADSPPGPAGRWLCERLLGCFD